MSMVASTPLSHRLSICFPVASTIVRLPLADGQLTTKLSLNGLGEMVKSLGFVSSTPVVMLTVVNAVSVQPLPALVTTKATV